MTVAALAQVACTGASTSGEDVGAAREDVVFDNGLVESALAGNALLSGPFAGSLVDHPLADSASLDSALGDASARDLFKYIVSCALPADAHIDAHVQGVTYGFDGGLGLAAEWGDEDGSCGAACRTWVSGCVIARLNHLGQPLLISLRGANDELASTAAERASYSHVEATYYGDIFAQPQQVSACLPPGKTSLPRVCGPSLAGCVVKVQGECEDLCGQVRSDGSYPQCRDAAPKNGAKGKKHLGSVTVFLQ